MSSREGIVRFGVFELDCKNRQLTKKGLPVRLPQQPLQLLAVLLERPGEIFTREELRQRLWEPDVFVDFDHGLNKSVQKLRDALGDSAESPRYIETVPRTGYRFIAPVRESVEEAVRQSGSVGVAEMPETEVTLAPTGVESISGSFPAFALPDVPGAMRSIRGWWVWLLCAVLVLAAVAVWILRPIYVSAPIKSLAVLPLENLSGDASQDYFADGMTDELITELAHIPDLRVVSRTSIMQDKGTHKSLQQIASELKVDAIVEGSIVRSGDRVRITAQLIDVRSDKHLWSQSFEGRLSDILSLQDSVANEIASHAKVVLRPEAERSNYKIRSINPDAHDAYLRGEYFLQKRDVAKSIAYFRQAVSLDSSYSLAYAGLANALESEYTLGKGVGSDVLPEAVASAKHAIELDPLNGEAYIALGGLETTYEWDWPAAERDLKRGIELSPSSSTGEREYAIYLDVVNRPEEAIDHMRKALSLDPLSFLINRHLGSTLYFARHYDEALQYLQRAGEMEPKMAPVVDNWISWTDEKKGLQGEAVEHDLIAMSAVLSKTDLENLRRVYKANGWKAYWQARLKVRYPAPVSGCGNYEVALNYLRIGDRDQAFAALGRAIDQQCYWMTLMQVNPLLDDIRTDARYGELAKRMHF